MITILSIDAWAGFEPKSWEWNDWRTVGEAPDSLATKSTRAILAWLRKEGYLTEQSKGRVAIEDGGCSFVIVDRVTRRPLFSLEYLKMTAVTWLE